MKLHIYRHWHKSYRLPVERRVNAVYPRLKMRGESGYKRLTPVLKAAK